MPHPDLEDGLALGAMLDGMHEAILHADFARLDALTGETEVLLSQIGPIRDATLCDRLRRKAHRNEACLAAAARGLRAARRRLRELQRVGNGLLTYGGNGKLSDIACGPTELSRRF